MTSFGSPHRHYAHTDSTNTRARELVETGAPGGTVVTATEQSEGRGRQGRVWTAPAGKGLLYTAILKPLDERHLMLPLSVPLAVCEAAESLRPEVSCQIKWPNDVWLEERKLAGILIEARPQDGWAAIGVGLNLTVAPEEFPDELNWPAVSLFWAGAGGLGKGRRSNGGEAPATLPQTALAAAKVLSHQLDRWVVADEGAVLAEWRRRDALLGREISWDEGSGVADGVDERGNLLVVVAGGDRVALGAGEVRLRL